MTTGAPLQYMLCNNTTMGYSWGLRFGEGFRKSNEALRRVPRYIAQGIRKISTSSMGGASGQAQDAMLPELPHASDDHAREEQYSRVISRLQLLIEGETDLVAVMSTCACELYNSFAYFHWTGFYRHMESLGDILVVGPYQGTHGCLRIPFSKGVCGCAARMRTTQLVPDVHAFPGHIACGSSTQSEVVVPLMGRDGCLLGVLDVDSNLPAAFTAADQAGLERVAGLLRGFGAQAVVAPEVLARRAGYDAGSSL